MITTYRGEYGVILINHGKEDFKIEKGMKLAQIIFERIGKAKFKIVSNLKKYRKDVMEPLVILGIKNSLFISYF